jgi:hypothetical protein
VARTVHDVASAGEFGCGGDRLFFSLSSFSSSSLFPLFLSSLRFAVSSSSASFFILLYLLHIKLPVITLRLPRDLSRFSVYVLEYVKVRPPSLRCIAHLSRGIACRIVRRIADRIAGRQRTTLKRAQRARVRDRANGQSCDLFYPVEEIGRSRKGEI